MKTTIDTLKRGSAVLGAVLCATMGLSAFGAVDITDFVRSYGTGNYHVRCGNGTKSYASVDTAFDGVTSGGDSSPDTRALLCTTNSGGATIPTPVSVLYYIDEGVLSHYDFKVTAFTLYRLMSGYNYLNRSPTEFELQGYDGSQWHSLFRTDETQTWDAETLSRTYEIPAENQACYRTYRFLITKNGGDASWSGFHELVLLGEVTRNALVWNGTEGAKWNATDANWLDRAGNVTNWVPGAKAVFDERGSTSIAVEGTNDVGGIVFSQTNVFTISGGALAMTHAAEIVGGGGDVGGIIASEFVDAEPVDEYQGIVNGQKNYFPTDPANTNRGAWRILWRNRNLAGITNFTGAVIQQNANTPRNAAPYHYENNGDWASVQFQSYPSGSALFCVKVLFAQIGADIYGRVAYVNFTWTSGRALGDDFDGAITARQVMRLYDGNVVDRFLDDSNAAYAEGFYGVVPHGGEWGTEPLKVSSELNSLGPSPEGGSFLPKNADDPYTGDAVLCFPGRKVADLCAVSSADLYYANTQRPSSMQYFTNTASKATVQVQGNTGADGVGAQLCVKVEFTDGVEGVYARAVYAKYDWSVKTVHDFDPIPADGNHKAAIYVGDTGSGARYGVKNIVAVFKGDRLTLGASAITLDRDITGDGTVRFAPLSGSQTISVPVARTIDKVVFGGITALSFAPGASLSIGAAEVEVAAAVSVSGANLLRIGTSRVLSKDQCNHFWVKGVPARQNNGGWMVTRPGIQVNFR